MIRGIKLSENCTDIIMWLVWVFMDLEAIGKICDGPDDASDSYIKLQTDLYDYWEVR